MKLGQLKQHLTHVTHQLGTPVKLGLREYRMRGYFGNRMAHGFVHEPFLTTVLKRSLSHKPGAFVDIGVNVGQTLIKVLALDPQRPYVGFEPQIGCCFFIDQFIRDNALNHMKVIPVALSNKNQLCSLFSNSPFDEMASISGRTEVTGREREHQEWVSARLGDEVIEEIGLKNIALIKIDVEGAELQVVQGLTKTLAIERPIVIFEVLPNYVGHERKMLDIETSRANSLIADKLYNLLRDAGYRISQIDSHGEESTIEKFNLDDKVNYVGSNFIAHPIPR